MSTSIPLYVKSDADSLPIQFLGLDFWSSDD